VCPAAPLPRYHPPPPSRTNWTRLVPPSALTGHVSSAPPTIPPSPPHIASAAAAAAAAARAARLAAGWRAGRAAAAAGGAGGAGGGRAAAGGEREHLRRAPQRKGRGACRRVRLPLLLLLLLLLLLMMLLPCARKSCTCTRALWSGCDAPSFVCRSKTCTRGCVRARSSGCSSSRPTRPRLPRRAPPCAAQAPGH